MKTIKILFAILIMYGCSSSDRQPLLAENHGSGACKECGCRSWRGDSEEPERCINIRVPTKKLCQHLYSQHK